MKLEHNSKRLILILSAVVVILIVDVGLLAIFLHFNGKLCFSSLLSYLWILLMFEGTIIILVGCFMMMPLAGFSGSGSGGRGVPRIYIPPKYPKESSQHGFHVLIAGIIIFILGWIIYFINL